jgi:hypothetical protein
VAQKKTKQPHNNMNFRLGGHDEFAVLREEDNEMNQLAADGGDDDDDGLFDIATERSYHVLLRQLREHNGEPIRMYIESRNLMLRVLHTVDEFCEALINIDCLNSFTLGGADSDDRYGEIEVWPKLELDTDALSQAWEKLCRAIHTVCSKDNLEDIILGGYLLSGECMARILRALQNTGDEIQFIKVLLPVNTISGNDYDSFVQAISYFQRHTLELEICGNIPTSVPSEEEYLAAEPANRFEEGGTISQFLCCLGDEVSVHLTRVTLDSEECESLAEIIGSSSCSIDGLCLFDCTLPANGFCIAEALRRNKTIKWLRVNNGEMEDAVFREAIISSLALNASITSLVLCNDSSPETILDVLRNVALTNTTITSFWDMSFPAPRDLMDLYVEKAQSLLDALRQNYTLEYYGPNNPFSYLGRLNQCGRRYLENDGASRSKCVALLAKVKDDLNCLFFHLRENPILCTMYDASECVRELKDKKRKATDIMQQMD